MSVPDSTAGLMVFIAAYGWYLLGSSATEEIKKILPVLIISASVGLSAISYLIAVKILPAPAGSLNLLTWTFGHHRLAGYLLFGLPLMIWAINQGGRWRRPAILSLAATAPIFLISAGRAAYLGAMAGIWYLLKTDAIGKRPGYSFMTAGAAVLLFFVAMPLVGRIRPIEYLPARGILIKPLSADSRLSYWSQAVRAVAGDPFGYGVETFRFQSLFFRKPGEATSGYVHNQYLSMFTETGIIGGILFLWLVITALRQPHRRAAETGDKLTAALTAGLIASAAAAVLDFDWQFPSIFLLFWLIAGVAGAGGENQDRLKPATAVLFAIPAIYGIAVLSGLKLQPTLMKNWKQGGEKTFSATAGVMSRLHPKLTEEVFETAKREMPIAEFGAFVKRQFPLYQYDNLTLARILEWQKSFGLKQEVLVTAAVMLDNNPLDKQAQQSLQEASASVSNP